MLGNEKLSERCFVWQHLLMKGCDLMRQGERSLTNTPAWCGVLNASNLSKVPGGKRGGGDSALLSIKLLGGAKQQKKRVILFLWEQRSGWDPSAQKHFIWKQGMKELHQKLFCVLYVIRHLLLQVLSFGSQREWLVLSPLTPVRLLDTGELQTFSPLLKTDETPPTVWER